MLLWEKEKLLVKCNFSFFHRVLKMLVLQTRKNKGLPRKGLRKGFVYDKATISKPEFAKEEISQWERFFHFPKLLGFKVICCKWKSSSAVFNPFLNKPLFLRVCSIRLLKTLWEKEKLLVTSNFSFSHGVFYPFGKLSAIFIKFKIVVCKLFQFGRV